MEPSPSNFHDEGLPAKVVNRVPIGLDDNDAEALPQAQTVTIFPFRPQGFVEFDITRAVLQWRCGAPNYGVVIRATNELQPGRGIRFARTVYKDKSKHPFALLLCV